MLFVFDDSLITGVDMVDSQHKAIFEIVNEFYYAMQHGKGYQAARGMLDFLADYVKNHFADEEKLMAGIGYGKYREHCKMHADLTEQLKEFMEFDELNEDLLNQITQTLVDWLNHHIKNEDKDFVAAYLRHNT